MCVVGPRYKRHTLHTRHTAHATLIPPYHPSPLSDPLPSFLTIHPPTSTTLSTLHLTLPLPQSSPSSLGSRPRPCLPTLDPFDSTIPFDRLLPLASHPPTSLNAQSSFLPLLSDPCARAHSSSSSCSAPVPPDNLSHRIPPRHHAGPALDSLCHPSTTLADRTPAHKLPSYHHAYSTSTTPYSQLAGPHHGLRLS